MEGSVGVWVDEWMGGGVHGESTDEWLGGWWVDWMGDMTLNKKEGPVRVTGRQIPPGEGTVATHSFYKKAAIEIKP